MATPTAQVLAEAAARRHTNPGTGVSDAQLKQEHEKRQRFRRLIDPGIMRPNPKQVAMDSLKTLSTMAENILREPDNPKYQTFKRENGMIQRRLVQPKGALEYAIELGFHPKVVEFQSYYVFNVARMDDLRIGASILREALGRETEKAARAQWSTEAQKAAAAAAAENVKLAFLDDRKNKMMRDQMEREMREARGAAGGSQAVSVALASSPPPGLMPGQGYTLAGVTVDNDTVDSDQPPPYNDE